MNRPVAKIVALDHDDVAPARLGVGLDAPVGEPDLASEGVGERRKIGLHSKTAAKPADTKQRRIDPGAPVGRIAPHELIDPVGHDQPLGRKDRPEDRDLVPRPILPFVDEHVIEGEVRRVLTPHAGDVLGRDRPGPQPLRERRAVLRVVS